MLKTYIIETLKLFINRLENNDCTNDELNQAYNIIKKDIDPLITYDQYSEISGIEKRKLVKAVNEKTLSKHKPKQFKLGRLSMFRSLFNK